MGSHSEERLKEAIDVIMEDLNDRRVLKEGMRLFQGVHNVLREEFPMTAPKVGEPFKIEGFIREISKRLKELERKNAALERQENAVWSIIDPLRRQRAAGCDTIQALNAYVAEVAREEVRKATSHASSVNAEADAGAAYALLAERGIALVPDRLPLTATLKAYLAEQDERRVDVERGLCVAMQALGYITVRGS